MTPPTRANNQGILGTPQANTLLRQPRQGYFSLYITDPMSHRQASILIVDGTLDNRQLLANLFVQAGYAVRQVLDGISALGAIAEFPPDLVVWDIQIMDMTGAEICQRLKRDNGTATIPVIFMGAIDSSAVKVEAFAVGGVDYMAKPFDGQEMLARVRSQLQIHELRVNLEAKNQAFQQAILELEMALLESARLRNNLERTNQELTVANQKLGEMAIVDALTQIPNRRRFDEYLDESWQQCLERQQPISLILGDIDCFKLYNDHYGHQMGDRCLFAVAQAVKKSVVLARDLPARYGGEEIAVILPNAGIVEAEVVAQRILKQVSELNIAHRTSLVKEIVSLSLGVHSVLPTPEETIGNLVRNCDQALYISKARGRDRLTIFAAQKVS